MGKKELSKREKMRKALKERNEEAYKNKNKYDVSAFKTFMIDDLPQWVCGEGQHRIDIVPYEIGENHPDLEEGDYGYHFDFWAHFQIGPEKESYVCPKVFGEKCPICEARAAYLSDEYFDEDKAKACKAKRRTLYNVIVNDTNEEKDKGVQVWHVSDWFMQKHLADMAKDEFTGETVDFADPDNGKAIKFTRNGTDQKSEFIGHGFVNRIDKKKKEYTISDEALENAFILEDCVKRSTYEEMYEAYWGKKVEDDDADDDDGSSQYVDDDGGEDEVNECPSGHKFGMDINTEPECEECDVWDDCKARKTAK